MVTDSATIDDRSFNQGTWKEYKQLRRLAYHTYMQPAGEIEYYATDSKSRMLV